MSGCTWSPSGNSKELDTGIMWNRLSPGMKTDPTGSVSIIWFSRMIPPFVMMCLFSIIPCALREIGQIGEAVKGLTSDSLKLREGCSIFLQRHSPEFYRGSTCGEGCVSTLRGASYATSEVTIKKTEMISWDRGFDSNQKQVWGAEKGGYIFKKISSFAIHHK